MKHIGCEADRIIREKRLKKRDIASLMGITDVYLSQIFKKESIDASLLEKLSQAIRVPISYWFDETNSINQSIVNSDGSAVSVYGNATAGIMADKDKEIEHLKQLLSEKERLIQVLMNK